jgi:ATP-dependent exoDNAse (exonuclease V) alpha subunit
MLPANYHEFDHGYAVTAHRSQGKTVDAVILSADAMKRELFYVGASRGRQEIVVVTSDREQLRELLGISTARPSAIELAREQTPFHPAPMLGLEQSPMQTIEPSLLREKTGYRLDLGMSR